jgi:hypothetical protein
VTTLGAFPDLILGETDTRACDLRARLAAGETITGASVTCSVASGTDPGAASMPVGSPVVGGAVVTQLLGGGVAGVRYELLYEAVTSSGRTLRETAALTVVAP